MSLYAALTLWLLVIMFSAWGVHQIWSSLIKPRVVNSLLLPGTLVAQLGHVMGLLITGQSVQNTKLMGDDEKGDPESDTPEQTRPPIIGPILVGLLPLVACAGCLYVTARMWGTSVLGGADLQVAQALPTSLPSLWQLLHGSITLIERLLDAILRSDLTNWTTILFLYLAVCLTVRMAPFEDNRRGAVFAIFLAALVIGIVATLVPAAEDVVRSSWPILSFAVGMLLFLLLVSLVVGGVVGLVRILVQNR